MGCCSEPLCCSRSTSANCSFCATWYLLLFLSAVLKICACLNPETHVRHQDIFIFSKLDNLNRTDSLAGLSSRTPHNSNRSQIIQFIQYFRFSVICLSYSFASPQCLSLIISYLRYFHWKPLTLVAFLFRRVSGGECCSCLRAVFSCSLCRQPIVVSPSPKQSCKELLDLPWLTLRLLGVWSLFCEAAWFCLWVAFCFFYFLGCFFSSSSDFSSIYVLAIW